MMTPSADPGSHDTVVRQTEVQDEASRAAARELSLRPLRPPAEVPGYQIETCLGEGAYGSVWRAFEQNTGKLVAIKFYTHRRGIDWSLLNREVEKLAVLYTSRNIVGLLEVGWDADPPFYVMEYLQNGSLERLLEAGPLPVHEALRMVRTVLQALVHAHGSGILHCDLKPANILLDGDFVPRLADFGQSRLSDEQQPALGTMFYMAPEQADLHAAPDARWDVYALGALLYQTLTGVPPHRTPEQERRIQATSGLEDRLITYRRLLAESPRPTAHRRVPGVDRRLAEIIERCLEIDPGKRYPNAQAVLDALDARDRHRTRRPWLTLGIAGPCLLLMSVAPVAHYALEAAVRSAQKTVIDRALESDALTVRILAQSVEQNLNDRFHELETIAADRRLSAAVLSEAGVPWERRTALRAFLGAAIQETHTEEDPNPDWDVSWFVTDRTGLQIYREPYSATTVDHNYAWRDYFHGRATEYPPDKVPADVQPITRRHVSLAFPSTATGQLKVALSVPVRDPESGDVVGVVARTISLGQLLSAYRQQLDVRTHGQVERIIALFDNRDYKLLDHPWMLRTDLSKLTPQEVAELQLDTGLREQFARLGRNAESRDAPPADGPTDDRSEDYHDPVGRLEPAEYGGRWLAAFWPVGETGWTAVVHERKAAALEPIEAMHALLMKYAWLALGICCGLIAALWYVIFRALTGDRADRAAIRRDFRSDTLSTISDHA